MTIFLVRCSTALLEVTHPLCWKGHLGVIFFENNIKNQSKTLVDIRHELGWNQEQRRHCISHKQVSGVPLVGTPKFEDRQHLPNLAKICASCATAFGLSFSHVMVTPILTSTNLFDLKFLPVLVE